MGLRIPGIHVLTAPAASPLEMYDFEVMTLVVSVKNWRAFCGPMHLYVDQRALDFLKKLGVHKLYDAIHVFSPEDFAGINRCYFWAAGKVVAAGKFSPPFVILDLDCAIHRRPDFCVDTAVQALNFEKIYPCYQDCESKYGHLLNFFSARDWDAPPVNVGMLGYYDAQVRDDYLNVATDAMKQITAIDPRGPFINCFRDHIIFVEQKLLSMMVTRGNRRLSVFEEGYFDGFLSTPRTIHLWGIKGEYLSRPEWKLGYLKNMLAKYPRVAVGITNDKTVSILLSPTAATRVFLPNGVWGRQGTKRWESMVSDGSLGLMPAMHCPPMLCGVTESQTQINFETERPADAYVEYGPTEGEIGKYRTRRVYRRSLFNFLLPQGQHDFPPGALVHYRVRARTSGERPFGLGLPHSFRLARPKLDAGPWCCSVGADSIGPDYDTQHRDFKDFHWAAAGRGGEEFHIAPGNIAHSRREPGAGVASWRAFRGDVEGVGREAEKCGDLPVFIALGDHEEDATPGSPSHAEARRARLPLGAFLQLPGQQTMHGDPKWKARYYYFTWGQALFLALDCETSYYPGLIGRTQRAWVEKTLRANTDYKWKVFFAHRPADQPSPGSCRTIAHSAPDRRWLLNLMETHRAQVFLHGHYRGWRVHQRKGAADWHVCAAWGAKPNTSCEGWSGNSFSCRLRFGMRWVGSRYEHNACFLTVEVVNAFRSTVKGGRIHRRFVIPC